jgi:ABC-type multidrug transport system fused ATPase/permease subunit
MPILSALTFDTKRVSHEGLRRLNLVLAGLFLVEGLVILFVSNAANTVRAVQTSYLAQDEIASQSTGHTVLLDASRHLFDLNLAYVVAAFLLISTAAHLLAATRRRKNYEAGLKNGTNSLRWQSYALSVSLMGVAVALFVGIGAVALLAAIALAVAARCLAAKISEAVAGSQARSLWSAPAAILTALIPLLPMAIYLWGAYAYGTAANVYQYAAFVLWGIYTFALLRGSLKAKSGKDYPRLERSYMLLSFVAMSGTAWLIFAGTR